MNIRTVVMRCITYFCTTGTDVIIMTQVAPPATIYRYKNNKRSQSSPIVNIFKSMHFLKI